MTTYIAADEKNLCLRCCKPTQWDALHRRLVNLPKRAFEHRNGLVDGFSKKYKCTILVWYELHETMIGVITREKQIKAGSRAKKLSLIEGLNPDWIDLYDTLV